MHLLLINATVTVGFCTVMVLVGDILLRPR
jgi:hypothetical protein